jgi:hypothetical protein
VVGAPRVDPLFPQSWAMRSSSPYPQKRRSFGVGLLPSGPQPVPPTNTANPSSKKPAVTADPPGRGLYGNALPSNCGHADLPSASAPAYRRFRVTGDAESPSLAHQYRVSERLYKLLSKILRNQSIIDLRYVLWNSLSTESSTYSTFLATFSISSLGSGQIPDQ